jgi:hypothetical protein
MARLGAPGSSRSSVRRSKAEPRRPGLQAHWNRPVRRNSRSSGEQRSSWRTQSSAGGNSTCPRKRTEVVSGSLTRGFAPQSREPIRRLPFWSSSPAGVAEKREPSRRVHASIDSPSSGDPAGSPRRPSSDLRIIRGRPSESSMKMRNPGWISRWRSRSRQLSGKGWATPLLPVLSSPRPRASTR